MNCKNKELEQEFLVEVTRVLKRETETPTYDDLNMNEYSDNCTSFELYKYISENSRNILFQLRIKDNIIEIGSFGSISIEIDNNQKIEILYLANVLKNKYIEKVLNSLKSR